MSVDSAGFNDDHRMSWEQDAEEIVEELLRRAEFDELRGVVCLPAMRYDSHGHAEECSSLEQLRKYLIDAYDNEWFATVPIEDGSPVFEGDADWAADSAIVDDGRFEEFFTQFRQPSGTEELAHAGDFLADLEASRVIRISLEDVNEELIEYLAKHPEKMRSLRPRKFEELVAAMFRNQGYDVTLTPPSKDGGFDIIAVQKDAIGTAMVIVECKRYAATTKVGVEIVRGLYGIVEEKRATRGVIATTSHFTKGAVDFQTLLPNRLALVDFDCLKRQIRDWKLAK